MRWWVASPVAVVVVVVVVVVVAAFASRVPALRERQAGPGLRSPACRASESGLDGRIQRVPWLRRATRARRRAAFNEVIGGPGTSTRVAPGAPAIEAPAHPAAPASQPVEKTLAFLDRGLASTGLRGRVDARGRRSGRAAGLTRTTGLGAGAPFRDRRPRRLRRLGLESGAARPCQDHSSSSRLGNGFKACFRPVADNACLEFAARKQPFRAVSQQRSEDLPFPRRCRRARPSNCPDSHQSPLASVQSLLR